MPPEGHLGCFEPLIDMCDQDLSRDRPQGVLYTMEMAWREAKVGLPWYVADLDFKNITTSNEKKN